MNSPNGSLTLDAKNIWAAGVAAARADRLLIPCVDAQGDTLRIGNCQFSVPQVERIFIAGAGKAAFAMAIGFLSKTEEWCAEHAVKIDGQIHTPDFPTLTADGQTADLARLKNPNLLKRIRLLSLRAKHANFPNADTVNASQRLSQQLSELGEKDLCVALLSGGGSALLCQPVKGTTLNDQLTVIQVLSENGADIQQMNTVRRCIDHVKSGGLAAVSRAQFNLALVLSDVIGDDMATIASGPTWFSPRPYREALKIVEEFDSRHQIPKRVVDYLLDACQSPVSTITPPTIPHTCIGNVESGIAAAARHAQSLGYHVVKEIASPPEWVPEKAHQLVKLLKASDKQICVISGGEPSLKLASRKIRGRGGRNQQLALAALKYWLESGCSAQREFCFLSGGTDGEDGPNLAAGGCCDNRTANLIRQHNLNLAESLARNDAGTLLEKTDSLLLSPPTHTNICDIRVFIANAK